MQINKHLYYSCRITNQNSIVRYILRYHYMFPLISFNPDGINPTIKSIVISMISMICLQWSLLPILNLLSILSAKSSEHPYLLGSDDKLSSLCRLNYRQRKATSVPINAQKESMRIFSKNTKIPAFS